MEKNWKTEAKLASNKRYLDIFFRNLEYSPNIQTIWTIFYQTYTDFKEIISRLTPALLRRLQYPLRPPHGYGYSYTIIPKSCDVLSQSQVGKKDNCSYEN